MITKNKESIILSVQRFRVEDLNDKLLAALGDNLLDENGEISEIYPEDLKGVEQFVRLLELKSEKTYYTFSVQYSSPLITEEISNVGLLDLFKDAKFDLYKYLERSDKLLDLSKSDFQNLYVLPHLHLIFELVYIESYDYYNGGKECDLEISFGGELNESVLATNHYVLAIKNVGIFPFQCMDIGWERHKIEMTEDENGMVKQKALGLHFHKDDYEIFRLDDWVKIREFKL